ncbi:hypothetical protein HBI75_174170 [Parastagonospora nodorum]|nr:hypothetical protein HBI75_174170 [Parastagonospora nodorum]KAH5109713.1 hypothetical protein HBH71_177580 [Parastagonospora nodorum]
MEKRDIAVLCAYTIILLLVFFVHLCFGCAALVKEERNSNKMKKMKDERCSLRLFFVPNFFFPHISLRIFFFFSSFSLISGAELDIVCGIYTS